MISHQLIQKPSPNHDRSDHHGASSSPKTTALKRRPITSISNHLSLVADVNEDFNLTPASTSPAVRSPAKNRAKLDIEPDTLPKASLGMDSKDTATGYLLESFPTTNQTVSESLLKEIMLALRSSI